MTSIESTYSMPDGRLVTYAIAITGADPEPNDDMMECMMGRIEPVEGQREHRRIMRATEQE